MTVFITIFAYTNGHYWIKLKLVLIVLDEIIWRLYIYLNCLLKYVFLCWGYFWLVDKTIELIQNMSHPFIVYVYYLNVFIQPWKSHWMIKQLCWYSLWSCWWCARIFIYMPIWFELHIAVHTSVELASHNIVHWN